MVPPIVIISISVIPEGRTYWAGGQRGRGNLVGVSQGPAATQASVSSWASTSLPWALSPASTCSANCAETPSCLPIHALTLPTGCTSQTGLHTLSCSPQDQALGLRPHLPPSPSSAGFADRGSDPAEGREGSQGRRRALDVKGRVQTSEPRLRLCCRDPGTEWQGGGRNRL